MHIQPTVDIVGNKILSRVPFVIHVTGLHEEYMVRRVFFVLIAALFLTAVASATCSSPQNAIEAENRLPGAPPSQWYLSGAGDSTIQGFATTMSVNVGQTVSFKVSTVASSYHIEIYRMGYYQGNGARLITSSPPPHP